MAAASSPLPLELLDSLVSFKDTLSDLRALLHSPFPPRSLFLHGVSNLGLLPALVHASFPSSTGSRSVQDTLPSHVYIDCAQLGSQKALFGRILNGLAGWDESRAWSDELGGVINWDGRLRGCSSVYDQQSDSYRIEWDIHAPQENDGIRKGIMGEKKDESLSAFIDGLKMIFDIQSSDEVNDHPTSSRIRPRFIVLYHAERLHSLETLPVGQTEGTLLAAIMRLGELTGKPVVPVLISSTDWLLLRPSRGATEPAFSLSVPCLSKRDLQTYLKHFFRPTSTLPQNTTSSLLASLADLLHQTFSPYLSGNETSDYLYLLERLWPDWVGWVENGQVENHNDVNRLVALTRTRFAEELDRLADLRTLSKPSQAQAKEEDVRPSLSRQNSLAVMDSPSRFYNSPSASATKRSSVSLQATAATPSSSFTQLALSLPIISRYLLIAGYLASSNPARKDVLMVAVTEDELLLSKRRKKGGAMRKTPSKRRNGIDKTGAITAMGAKSDLPPARLLGPKAFPVERLLAIFECILPVDLRSLARSPDTMQELARLTGLRLLVKTTASASASMAGTVSGTGGGTGSAGMASVFDKLEGIKLKINNLELESVEALGRSVGFKVAERLWEAAA